MANHKLALTSSAVALLAVACTTPETATGTHPEGPPMVEQLFLYEQAPDATGRLVTSQILAFGTHPDVDPVRNHGTERASANAQMLRVVFDELLLGNHLEEIRCRTRTINDAGDECVVPSGYQQIPEGTDPDDIADCSVPDDVLTSTCHGAHAVCVNDAGIPCGVFDADENGSADDLRMIAGQVKVKCGSFLLDVIPQVRPLEGHNESSFWQPAGNQLVPAGQVAGTSLGPALILRPFSPTGEPGLMPTGQTCSIVFADDVVDKEHNRPCAPASLKLPIGTAPTTPPTIDFENGCTAGDMSALTFKIEPLFVTFSTPAEAATGVSIGTAGSPPSFSVIWNTKLDAASATGITLTQGTNTPRTDFTATVSQTGTAMTINMANPLLPNTAYTLTLANAKDTYGIPPPAPVSIHFTTGT